MSREEVEKIDLGHRGMIKRFGEPRENRERDSFGGFRRGLVHYRVHSGRKWRLFQSTGEVLATPRFGWLTYVRTSHAPPKLFPVPAEP